VCGNTRALAVDIISTVGSGRDSSDESIDIAIIVAAVGSGYHRTIVQQASQGFPI
jgi:hypothetical protein